ncbi:hypothetical protein CR513_23030, partial [Mucuna pruriens]
MIPSKTMVSMKLSRNLDLSLWIHFGPLDASRALDSFGQHIILIKIFMRLVAVIDYEKYYSSRYTFSNPFPPFFFKIHCDTYMEGKCHITHEGFKNMEITTLESAITRDRLRKFQGEVHQELGLFKGQGGSNNDSILYTLFKCNHVLEITKSEKVRRHDRLRDEPKRNPMNLIKDKIPPFAGKDDPNDYDWEMKVKQNFECIDCKDMIKVKLIALSFEGYALIWWNDISIQIRGMRRAPIESWAELKREIRERFVPCFYKRDIFVKLQITYQGTKSIEEYFKEIEITLIRAQPFESQETTMARFLHGLNRDIHNIVELQIHLYLHLYRREPLRTPT